MYQVRRRWLVSFCLYWGIGTVFTVLLAVSTAIPEIGVKNVEMVHFKTMMIFTKTMPIASLFIWAWITYHCAYKKRGTKWLMWTLIVLPITAFVTFSQLFIPNSPMKILLFHSVSGWILSLFGLMWVSVIYYWINCYRLRKENLVLKKASKSEPDTAS